MNKFILAAAASLAATSALAQSRPSSLAMSCNQARALVASRGAVVLGTGGHTYERFVVDQRFCLRQEVTEPVWAPTADTPQCPVGYRCKESDPPDW